MIKRILLLVPSICFYAIGAMSQGVAVGATTPDASAMFEVRSTAKGLLIPRLTTTQRGTITTPATGLQIYNTTTNTLEFYNGTAWQSVTQNPWVAHTNGIYYSAGKVGIGTTASSVYPLSVYLQNTGVGNAIANFASNDTWHSALYLANETSNQGYAFVVGGTSNIELKPNNFGIYNGLTGKWPFTIGGTAGYVGFGDNTSYPTIPKAPVHLKTGDVYLEQIGKGIIMKSPNGNCWRVTIDDTGNLVRTAIACP